MEIQTLWLSNYSRNEFKIDLIVWKWKSGDIWKLFATEFKIDLIVWK